MTAIRLSPAIGAALALLAVPALAAPADAEAQRARLNREQAQAAQAQLSANAASQQAHDLAMADFDRAMAAWKADAIACRDGDRTRCR
ncbi:MAG: hypothetical protein R3D83_08475 [Caenibius sp.]